MLALQARLENRFRFRGRRRGHHPTTLVKFRNRLLEHEKASIAFDKVLEQLIDLKLVSKGSKQRIDATHVVGKVRELSRLEIFHETLKLLFKEIESLDIELTKSLSFLSEFYLDDPSIRGLSDSQKKRLMRNFRTSTRPRNSSKSLPRKM